MMVLRAVTRSRVTSGLTQVLLDLIGNALKDLLTHSGYAVAEAGNSQDGVANAKSERPDLILIDIQMPVIDGYYATRGAARRWGPTAVHPSSHRQRSP